MVTTTTVFGEPENHADRIVRSRLDRQRHQKAGAKAGLLMNVPTSSVARSLYAPSRNGRVRSWNTVALASSVPDPWYGHSCRAARQQPDGTLLRFRDARPPWCVLVAWVILPIGRQMPTGQNRRE